MHRRTTISLGALAPWWLLFLALFLCVSLQAKSFDVAVQVSDDRPATSQTTR